MFAQFVARQLGHPSGLIGRWLLGPLWNRRNRALNDVSLDQLALQADDRVLEGGFGGGYLLGRMLPQVTDGFIGGVDISAAMVEQCRARYHAVIQTGKMDLKVGTAERLPYPAIYFSKPAHTFSSIEWRLPNTTASLVNNLVNGQMRERDGAHGTLSNTITTAHVSWFVNASTGELHLLPTAITVIDVVAAPAETSDDIDGEPRPIGNASDIGADEYGSPAPLAVNDLRVTHASTAGNILTATLRWTAPANALTTTLRYSGTLITVANWNGAALLTGSLHGAANVFTATVTNPGGMVYFALKSRNGTDWSARSNNAFWPQQTVYLPIILQSSP